MTLRPATVADLPLLLAIRDNAGDNRLSDPRVVTEEVALRLIAESALTVWQEAGEPITGFAAGDPRNGTIWAVLVAPGQDGKGIGRALLAAACDTLCAAGHPAATIRLEPGTAAERHYRAAGWLVTASDDDGVTLQKALARTAREGNQRRRRMG